MVAGGNDEHGGDARARAATVRVIADAWERATGRWTDPVDVRPLEPAGWDVPDDADRFVRVGRLEGAEGAVVAVRASAERVRHEGFLYGDLLPTLGVVAPRLRGLVVDDDGVRGWLFAEALDVPRFDRADPVHRRELAAWLGALHGRGRGAAGADLPDRGPAHLAERLERADVDLDPAGRPADAEPLDAAVLDAARTRVTRLRDGWDRVRAELADEPTSLVHGDLKPGNLGRVAVPEDPRGLLSAYDWESAGWGPIAIDLGTCGVHEDQPEAYLDAAARTGLALDPARLPRSGTVGRVLRGIMTMSWAARRAAAGTPAATTERHLDHALRRLAAADALGW